MRKFKDKKSFAEKPDRETPGGLSPKKQKTGDDSQVAALP